ncbi:MAG: RNA 2',3'-cyclic phosphodiesterase [Pseudomonadales bacterium]|nr:RNA 2',3'-cyclic phosphodiesterase [Pseudomonadales bacterium]
MSSQQIENKIRGFVGIRFNLHKALLPLHAELEILTRDKSTKLRVVPPDNLHITLKFLGNVEQDRLASLESMLLSLSQECSPLQIDCRGVGFFKNSIWVGIEENPALALLSNAIDEACGPLGFAKESKKYVPHVTVARFGKEARIKLSDLQRKFAQQDWGKFTAEKIALYKSETLPTGAIYSVLTNFDLSAIN